MSIAINRKLIDLQLRAVGERILALGQGFVLGFRGIENNKTNGFFDLSDHFHLRGGVKPISAPPQQILQTMRLKEREVQGIV